LLNQISFFKQKLLTFVQIKYSFQFNTRNIIINNSIPTGFSISIED